MSASKMGLALSDPADSPCENIDRTYACCCSWCSWVLFLGFVGDVS